MSDANYRLTIRNDAQWPIFLSIAPWQDGYSSCITMGDGDPQLGDTRYVAPGGTLSLFFWRSGSCHGEQGWLALRAAYNPFSTLYDGAWQQFWFDTDGGFEEHGNNASYPNTLTANGRDGDTALFTWAFTDAADWPAAWSRTPLQNPIDLAYTNQYDKVWDDSGSGAIFDGSIYKPKLDGYFNLGFTSFGPASYDPVGGVGLRAALVAKPLQAGVVVPPDTYQWIGDDHNSGAHGDCSWWAPVPPPGFVALGTAFVSYHGMPPRDAIACIREDLAGAAKGGKMVYADRGSGGSHDIEIFEVDPDAPECVQVGASVVSSQYIYGDPPKLSGVTVAALKPPARADKSDALTRADVDAIIAGSAPLLLLHPQEYWMPIAADIFVNAATRSGNYLTVNDPNILKGDLSTAKAYVFANYVCSQFTDLQFWFFYGYNGPPFIQIQLWVASGGVFLWSHDQNADNLNCGQHQGDWENITLRVDNRQKRVVAVGYAAHGDTEWYSAPATGQVKSYSALHVHSSYPVAGEMLELAGWEERDLAVAHLEVEIYSRNICADGGQTLDCATHYQIVGSDFLTGIETPPWLGPDFAGVDWGPPVEHEDRITINDVPIIGSYTYDYKKDDSGASTPSFNVS
jgi:hypothetical protein